MNDNKTVRITGPTPTKVNRVILGMKSIVTHSHNEC